MGKPIGELCREHGITDATYYRWKAKYGGLEVSETRRLKSLEDENRRLKHLVADLTLDNQALKGLLNRKEPSPRPEGRPWAGCGKRTGWASGGRAD